MGSSRGGSQNVTLGVSGGCRGKHGFDGVRTNMAYHKALYSSITKYYTST